MSVQSKKRRRARRRAWRLDGAEAIRKALERRMTEVVELDWSHVTVAWRPPR